MRTFISFEEAQQIVLGESRVLASETCALSDALGRTLSQRLVSSENVPPFASSAMDGFAVRLGEDSPHAHPPFRMVEHIAAGMMPQETIVPGTCSRIMTGAPIPSGANTIVPREHALENGGWVTFSSPITIGKHIRPAGEDIRAGEEVFSAGTLITPPVVGMLATLGCHSPAVVRRPLVAIISSGNEIVAPDQTPGPSQIRNSNGPSLRAQVLSEGGICDSYDHAADAPSDIRAAIQKNSGADLILFSGGVSVGDHDFVKQVLDDMGFEPLFWKVKQRPGKPLVFGKLGSALVLGLPGNPVSTAMCFAMYARPLIRRFLGRTPIAPLTKAFLAEDVQKVKDLHYFSRAVASQDADGRYSVSMKGPQGSNLYGSVVRANCILHLPAGEESLTQGSVVFIERLPWSDLHLS